MEKELSIGFYNTPPLWIKTQFGVSQFDFPYLDFSNLTIRSIPGKLRLGHQMEHVFDQLLSHSNHWEILAKNIIVDEGKVRVGELDFILENKIDKKAYHVELAYKFYIINPDISEPIHRLMGPNKRDMFYTKLDKLREKQFPLLLHKELNIKLLRIHLNPSNIIQQACFKAQLFVPYGNLAISVRPLNKKCMVGSWVRFDDFNTLEFKKCVFYIPFKQEWVLEPSLQREYITHYQTLLDINIRMLKENAPMLWMKKPNNHLEKLFVVWW